MPRTPTVVTASAAGVFALASLGVGAISVISLADVPRLKYSGFFWIATGAFASISVLVGSFMQYGSPRSITTGVLSFASLVIAVLGLAAYILAAVVKLSLKLAFIDLEAWYADGTASGPLASMTTIFLYGGLASAPLAAAAAVAYWAVRRSDDGGVGEMKKNDDSGENEPFLPPDGASSSPSSASVPSPGDPGAAPPVPQNPGELSAASYLLPMGGYSSGPQASQRAPAPAAAATYGYMTPAYPTQPQPQQPQPQGPPQMQQQQPQGPPQAFNTMGAPVPYPAAPLPNPASLAAPSYRMAGPVQSPYSQPMR